MDRFTDKTVVITGAGSGLGRAAAVRLGSEGASLTLVDIAKDGLSETEAAVREVSPQAQIVPVVADVSRPEDAERYVATALERFSRIDGFFNNAGIEGRPNLTADYGVEEFDRVVAVNLRGMFLGLEKVLAVMRRQGGGAVVNSASVGGIMGVENASAYVASKHGVVGLTRTAAIEYAPFGVRVNAIAPGRIWTPMIENVMRKLNPEDPEGAAEQFIGVNPTQRYGQPHEIASAVAFLLSEDASYVNATVLPIDGGQSAKYL
ncbi:glucose 1-dehydrogenase [Streptomyces sp. NPDC096132]|uniref:glucose 1-dehydrogenase n=1 Tax=Streptomyces sp. NPDC096132 TaxID=3366075 RepID=UPI00382804AD